MNYRLFVNPRMTVLSLKRRDDRRQVAVSSAMSADFPPRDIHFFDAIDAKDYASMDEMLHDAIKDGFEEFDALWGYPNRDSIGSEAELKMGFAPLAYAWSLCRYFRELSNRPDDEVEFFMHDDMHGVSFKHFHVEKMFLRNLYNDPILGRHCKPNQHQFVAFLVNTASVGLMPTQAHVFEDIVVGTNKLNLKAGLFSPYGAGILLKRLRQQIAIGKKNPREFLGKLEEIDDWKQTGIYSTREPLFVEYPVAFLGSDVRNIPRLQGRYAELFGGVKPND